MAFTKANKNSSSAGSLVPITSASVSTPTVSGQVSAQTPAVQTQTKATVTPTSSQGAVDVIKSKAPAQSADAAVKSTAPAQSDSIAAKAAYTAETNTPAETTYQKRPTTNTGASTASAPTDVFTNTTPTVAQSTPTAAQSTLKATNYGGSNPTTRELQTARAAGLLSEEEIAAYRAAGLLPPAEWDFYETDIDPTSGWNLASYGGAGWKYDIENGIPRAINNDAEYQAAYEAFIRKNGKALGLSDSKIEAEIAGLSWNNGDTSGSGAGAQTIQLDEETRNLIAQLQQQISNLTAAQQDAAAAAADRDLQRQQEAQARAAEYQRRIDDLKPLLDAWQTAAINQQTARVDYATEQGVNDLLRAQEDAQKEFMAAQEQISAEEAVNKDNQALYAEARGDKGGIGAAQYDSIMNTAAINRQAVREQQTKLATDTWRQIADLRAQGEFEKADAVLEISQTYLSNLLELEQWAANYNLSAAQFEESIREWEKNFELSVGELLGSYKGAQTLAAKNADRNFALSEGELLGSYKGQPTLAAKNADRSYALQEAGITGEYNGQPTYAAQQNVKSTLASAGNALLKAGIMPSDAQLEAMGLTADEAQSLIIAAQAAAYTGTGVRGTDDVRAIQTKLNELGVNLTVDGVWGPKTAAAAKELLGISSADEYTGLDFDRGNTPSFNFNILSDYAKQLVAQAAENAARGSSFEAELVGLMDIAMTNGKLIPGSTDYNALVSYAKGGK